MSKMVAKAFETQRRLNFQMGIPRDVKIEGAFEFRVYEQERTPYDAHYRELYSPGYCEGV